MAAAQWNSPKVDRYILPEDNRVVVLTSLCAWDECQQFDNEKIGAAYSPAPVRTRKARSANNAAYFSDHFTKEQFLPPLHMR